MFKSFFPSPKLFFLSAAIWGLFAVICWQIGLNHWLENLVGASQQVAINATRFWSLKALTFYAMMLFILLSVIMESRICSIEK